MGKPKGQRIWEKALGAGGNVWAQARAQGLITSGTASQSASHSHGQDKGREEV